MELNNFNTRDLILAGLKSEEDSKRVYNMLANEVRSPILRNRLRFLAGEEEGHEKVLEHLYKAHFPGEDIKIPDETEVPVPDMEIFSINERNTVTKVMKKAMEAELAAREFYQGLAERFLDEREYHKIAHYLADMEMSHYRILESEAKYFKDMDVLLEPLGGD